MTAKTSITTLLIVALMAISASIAKADQYGQYGNGGEDKDISVDKVVKHPDTGEYKENLFASDYKFSPDQDVHFKVTVRNTGDKDLIDVKMRDILPDYLKHLSGDLESSFDLAKDEEKVFYIAAKTAKREDLPNDNGVYCVVNTVEAWFEDKSPDKDTSEVCIEKKGEVLGAATALPEAGPEHTIALMVGTLILALTGSVLLKKSK